MNAPLNRRHFLGASAATAVTGLGFTLGFSLTAGPAEAAAASTPVNSWLTVGTDNRISLTVGVTEMGQGSMEGLAQILAEDLMVNPARVAVLQGAPTQAAVQPIGAAFTTGGSGAIRNNFAKLRLAGAKARETLVAAAMQAVGDVNRSSYTVADGVITHTPSGRILTYGEVAATAATLTPPVSASLVPDAQLRSIGKPLQRVDIPLKVDGRAVYGIDVRLPGLVYAAVRHCPTYGGVLAATPAKPSGASAVVPLKVWPGTGRGRDVEGNVNAVAVVGATTWDANRLARSLSVSWTLPADSASITTPNLMADAKALLTGGVPYGAGATTNVPGTVYTVESVGTPDAAIAASPKTLSATYTLPYVAHACMEVLNCTVNGTWDSAGVLQSIEVWAPTQVAKSAQAVVMAITGLPEAKVKLNVTFLGGGLGRKLEVDFISQAVQVALAIRKPVMLVWSREEDFTHDQYRPMAAIRVQAGLSGSSVAGWKYRVVSPSIAAQRGRLLGATGDSQGFEAAQDLPYRFGSRLTEYVTPSSSPIPLGYWRSVGASLNTFAVESMIDEVAAAAGIDPYQWRQTQLSDARWLAVLNAAVGAAGGSLAAPTGSARGVAIGLAFNSIVATVVEVSKNSTTGAVRVNKVWIAIDNGLSVNPDQVEAQIVGGMVHGLNAALYGRQTFVNGAAQSRNFNTSRMIRRSEMPAVTVKILGSASPATAVSAAIGGVGELGVPTLAPALANAWARLTGVRVRDLPFYPNATMGG